MEMKEAIITDLNGRRIEPTLVEKSVAGVFDIRQPVEGEEAQTALTGYTVAIRPPDGFYQAIFDVAGYRQAVQAYEVAKRESDSESESENTESMPQAPQPIHGTSFWREGLTAEEIQALHEKHKPEPSPMEYLGKQLVGRELEALELRKQNQATGASIVATELRILEKWEANKHV